MKQFLSGLSVTLLTVILSGCEIIYTIDYIIPRYRKAVEVSAIIEFQYKNRPLIVREIRFEQYYDKHFSYRGNYWAFREVGLENNTQRSSIKIVDKEIGPIIFPLPIYYDEYEKEFVDDAWYTVTISNKTYTHISSEGNKHTHIDRLKDGSIKSVTLDYSFEVNDVILKMNGKTIEMINES